MHPEEVPQSCKDLHAKNLLPRHFGSFDRSNEPLKEAARLIKHLKSIMAFEANLVMPAVGEPVII